MTQTNNKFETSGSRGAWIALFASLFALIGIYIWQQNQDEVTVVNIPVIREGGGVEFGDSVSWDQGMVANARETGEYIGCGDSLFFIEKEVVSDQDPITLIYEHLFEIKTPLIYEGNEYLNPVAYQTDPNVVGEFTSDLLQFDRVEVTDGTARVHLSGDYISIGTCEPPQTEAVLRFAALQFPHIDEVRIYRNDIPAEFIHGGPNGEEGSEDTESDDAEGEGDE